MNGQGIDGGTFVADAISTWFPVLSVALMILFAVLAARKSTWSWLAAGVSGIAMMVPSFVAGPGVVTFGLWPLTLPTLLVPLLGWWNWNRISSADTAEKIPVRHASGKHYLIAGALLIIPGLFSVGALVPQDALIGLSVGQAALAILGLFIPGALFVALLGFAFGLVESWWLLLLDSAWYLVPAVLGFNAVNPLDVSVTAHVAMAVLHAGIIVAAIFGYRFWNTSTGASQQTARLQGNL